MQEHTARFVATQQLQPLPPPDDERGFAAVVRHNLFSTPRDSILSVLAGLFIVWAIWNLIDWGLVNAVFTGENRDVCLSDAGEVGACWAFVRAKFGQFIYGVYPLDDRWRIDVAIVLLVVLVAGIAIPKVPYKKLNAILLLAVFPFVTLILLTGGRFSFSGGEVALLVFLAAVVTISDVTSNPDVGFSRMTIKAALGLAGLAFVALLLSSIVNAASVTFLDMRLAPLTLISLLASAAAIVLSIVTGFQSRREGAGLFGLLMPTVVVIAFIAAMSANFGLEPVSTNLWGGLMVTLVVAISGIAASLPLGILLALGRRSQMPAVKLVCVIFIEFWRGVPLITVLFMANFMLPLFLPEGVNFNQLLRALVGVALFSAAYMAEVIRGGLQAIPKGQYEGADAMALTYWQKMRMIILPQALKLVIPGIVNTFIGLFKDTSLVYIIGLADLLGTVRRGFNDPSWITPSTPATGLVFAAFVYWLFCFSMSRYSIYTERRLDTGHKR